MSYNKILKRYKVMDAIANKNLINDEITLQLVKQPNSIIPPEPRGMPKWFKEWLNVEFRPLISNIEKRLDQNGLKPLTNDSK